MEHVTISPPIPYARYPGLTGPDVSLFEHVEEAIWRLDIAECVRFVSWANENPSEEVVEPLSILVTRPTRRRFLRIWYRPVCTEMRKGAITGLKRTRLVSTAPALANALMYELGETQALAKSALLDLGGQSQSSLAVSLQTCKNWPLRGMLETIDALAQLREPGSCPVLVSILTSQIPRSSSRWDRSWLRWSVGLGFIIGLCVAVFAGHSRLLSDFLSMAMFAWLVASAACAIPVGLVMERLKSKEGAKVRLAATDAIVKINDPNSIPDLLDAASGAYRLWARRNSLDALAGVLPAVGWEHQGMLDGIEERRLSGLIAADTNKLTLAVVRALEFVGTGQSATIVERFVRSKPVGVYQESMATALNEALRILPILQERLRLEQEPAILLRASQFDGGSAEQLLRSASERDPEQQAGELLRPSSNNPD